MIGSPNIAVVISTYNRPNSLRRLLDNLARQYNIDPRKLEVCVVDDGSRERFEYSNAPFQYQYIYRDRSPDNTARVYSSRNIAVAHTTAPWILQMDDDLEIEDWTIAVLSSWAGLMDEAGLKYVVMPRISNNSDVDTSDRDYHRGQDGRWWRGKASWAETHWESSSSAGMFMSRALWNEVGGYDEQFDGCMGASDQELVLRCQKVGAKVMIAPFYVNIADEETGSWRMKMIDGRKRSAKNEDLFWAKHPDAKGYTNV